MEKNMEKENFTTMVNYFLKMNIYMEIYGMAKVMK